jgi:hypothetical protein
MFDAREEGSEERDGKIARVVFPRIGKGPTHRVDP